jgi:phage-related protein
VRCRTQGNQPASLEGRSVSRHYFTALCKYLHCHANIDIFQIVDPRRPKPPQMKPLEFLGSSRDDLAAMPAGVRHNVGLELMRVQFGGEPSDFKPMPSVGAGVYEIRVRDASGAYRAMYLAKFETAVYVLHAFQKKTQQTAKKDVELGRARYRMIGGKP